MADETIFTKIINKEIPSSIIYEDDKHLAFLDIFPFEKGHTLVIPKKHFKTIFDMPEKEYLELQKIVLKVAKHLENELNCGVNIVQNNKKIAGQEINHVHFHVIPRLEKKELLNSKAGVRYLKNEIDNFQKKLKFS